VGYLFMVLSIILIDQISKAVVVANMKLGETIYLIPDIFRVTYSENPGAAFGIMAYRTNFFIIVTVILLIVIAVLIIRLGSEYKLFKIGLALQSGGAVGNLIDRVRTGYVVDFLDLTFWPIFNVADIAIVIGVLILVISIIKEPIIDNNDKQENKC